jgi:tetratricopeptide (TPR) repeat protein
MEIRVEDHAEPVEELKRLVKIHRAYHLMNKGDEHIAKGDVRGALDAYGKAMDLAPGNPEVQFWAAVTMFTQGEEDEALRYFKEVFKADLNWVEVIRRLPESGLLPEDEEQINKILSAVP